MNDDLIAEILASSQRLGIDPVDLATIMSFETGGTFDPRQPGPTTKWGQHIGLIQMGEPQRQEFGYDPNGPLQRQMQAVEKYLTKAGVRPGMGLLDVYSAVNAGGVGRYGASDTAAGGTWGTVRDKVEQQMGGHRQKAMALLGNVTTNALQTPVAPTNVMTSAPQGLAALYAPPVQEEPTFGGLAANFMQQSAERRRQREEMEAADQARRIALFGGGVSGLYG